MRVRFIRYNMLHVRRYSKTLTSIEVLISNALIDSRISHDELVLINNVLKEYDEITRKKELRRSQFVEDFSLFIKQRYCIDLSVERIQKITTQNL